MTFEEIIRRLRERDEKVTQCFFFWDGPSMSRIGEIRRTNPGKAAQLKKPVCNSCRPVLLKILHGLYGSDHFDYDDLVTSFYLYLTKDDKLSSIKDPNALMGWIASTAYYFFLHEKINYDKMLAESSIDSLSNIHEDVEVDENQTQVREFVNTVMNAMPNRLYAKILDEIILEVGQYKGKEKADTMRRLSDQFNMPIDNLYAKISLAKKQFKETAKRLNLF